MKPFFVSLLIFPYFVLPCFASPDPIPVPDPLSLEAALALPTETHPTLRVKENAIDIAKSQLDSVASVTNLDIRVRAEARYIEPPESLKSLGREDHRASIVASKLLYDFGRTSNSLHAVHDDVEIAELELSKAVQVRRLDIMQAFFNVVLADLQFNYDNEAMAIYFIQYDRAKERYELGQLSEIDVLQKQSEYMEVRRNRFRSAALQRSRRVTMSEILDRPAQIVSNFLAPKLDYHKFGIVDVDKLQQQAVSNNLSLRILRKKLEQARAVIKSLRANKLPLLTATAEAGVYSREIGSNDAWRIGVGIDVPLYQGSRVDSRLAMQNKIIDQINLEIYQKELSLKNEILSLWLEVDVLLKQKESTDTGLNYREIYLDRARSLYEMEVKADLGDSMVALTAAAKYEAETEFEIAMKWERLRYLTQMDLEDLRQ